jgi:predicted PurR-regulated permease PerM
MDLESNAVSELPAPSPLRVVSFWLAVALAAALCVCALGSVLPPFVGGVIVAFVLRPACGALERLGLPHRAAAAVLIGGFFVAAITGIALVVPFAWSEASDLAMSLPDAGVRASAALHRHWHTLTLHLVPATVAKAESATTVYLQGAADTAMSLLQRAVAGGFAIMDIASFAVLSPLVAFYLLSEWSSVFGWFDRNLPRTAAPIIRQHAAEIDQVLSAWLRWEGFVCLVLAAYYAAALSLCGLRFGLLIGLATGFLAFVPYVGYLGGLTAALVACAFTFGSWHGWALVGATFLVGNILDAWILTPKLIGRKVGLHDFWVIFALMSGAHLMGFVGVALAVPGARSWASSFVRPCRPTEAVLTSLTRYALQSVRRLPAYQPPDRLVQCIVRAPIRGSASALCSCRSPALPSATISSTRSVSIPAKRTVAVSRTSTPSLVMTRSTRQAS